MISYVTAFIFYTLAMIGVLLVGFIIYKKTFIIDKNDNRGTIKILDSLPIGNKKNLLIIKIKNEKFLIASGVDHTTFLSKLEDKDIETSIKTENILTPEVIDMPLIEKIHNNNFKQQEATRYDDTQLNKNSQLQKQFMDLYSKEDSYKATSEANKRKEALRQIFDQFQTRNGVK